QLAPRSDDLACELQRRDALLALAGGEGRSHPPHQPAGRRLQPHAAADLPRSRRERDRARPGGAAEVSAQCPEEPEQNRNPSSPLGPTDATPVHLAFAIALHSLSFVQRCGLPSGGYGSVPGSKIFLLTQPLQRFEGSSGFGNVMRK